MPDDDDKDIWQDVPEDLYNVCHDVEGLVEEHRKLLARCERLEWELAECRKQLKKEQELRAQKHVQGGKDV